MNFYIAILAFLFAAFRELSEHAKEGNFAGLPAWWNTPESYVNKDTWHLKYLPILPSWMGKLLFRTVLVWTTDAEHFFQFVSFLAVITAIALIGGWQLGLAFYIGAQVIGALKPLTSLR